MNTIRLSARLIAMAFLVVGLLVVVGGQARASGSYLHEDGQVSRLVAEPEISITSTLPLYGWPWISPPPDNTTDRQPLQGQVANITSVQANANYYVTCYIFVPDYSKITGETGWWLKPRWNDTKTPISASTGTWKCQVSTGGVDEYATIYRAYLFPKTLANPPLTPPEPCVAPTCAELVRPNEELVPPETTIVSCPDNPTGLRNPILKFYSSHTSNQFLCILDGVESTCSSPKKYSELAIGLHTFSVYAEDKVLNTDPTPASCVWEIVATAKPGVPVLTNPVNDALVDSLQPAFDWKDAEPPAQYYQIQVSRNNTFTDLVIDETDIQTSDFKLVSDLEPGKRYYWRVQAFNVSDEGSGWSTQTNARFRTPLAAPTLVSPTDGQSLSTDRPAFDWDAVPGAGKYNIQVSQSQNFGTLLVNANVSTTDFAMTKDLPQNKTLYWRVRAKTQPVPGPWSQIWSFKTGNPPNVPVLLLPLNNAWIVDYTLLFTWKPVTVPPGTTFDHYEFCIDDAVGFPSPDCEDTSQTQYAPIADLTPNSSYYWRVRAFNTVGLDQHSSGWSQRSFHTAFLPPVLTSPPDSSTLDSVRPNFDWQDVDGATSYIIQVSRNNTFTQLVVNARVGQSAYNPLKDLPNCAKSYSWRVKGVGPYGTGNWSAVWSFAVDPEACAYAHLYSVMDAYRITKNGKQLRFLDSYKGINDGDVGWVYDNSLAMIAMMNRNTDADWDRAKILADTFVYLQDTDPAQDGRVRDAYHAKTLVRATNQSATGNMAWVALALLRYYQEKGGAEYLNAATELGQWIFDNTHDTRGIGGYTGGYATSFTKFMWKGTEHNLGVYVVFMELHEVTGDVTWRTRAMAAKGFVASMWNDTVTPGHFWTGTWEDGVTTNTSPIPEDAQSWGLISLGEKTKYGQGLTWVKNNLSVNACSGCPSCSGFRFSTTGSGCWWESAAHMTVAFRINGNDSDADNYLVQLQKVQTSVTNNNGRGIVAACPGGAITGYGWKAPNVVHVGATAWFIFAERDFNPLWGIGTGDPIPYEGEY